MSIQQNVNQMVSLAGFIGSQIMRTKQEQATLAKAASAEEQKVRMEDARQKFEEAEISYLQLEGRKKTRKDWITARDRAKKEGSKDPEYYDEAAGSYKTLPTDYKWSKDDDTALYESGKALSGAAEIYYGMGGPISTEKMARYRNLGTAEPPATAKTKPEIDAENADQERIGKTKVEQKRRGSGKKLPPKGTPSSPVPLGQNLPNSLL